MNDKKVINSLKGLIIDGVNSANSGHPGGAMSSTDFAYILFSEYLNLSPQDPKWPARDRFILSAGHESMLQYSLLHGIGWLSKDDLKNFRQLHSKTPGHPENYLTPGVECATGPLGQGCGMSVGFAIAAAKMTEEFGSELFNNYTWVLLGDGCMQEGITYGAASLAGHLGLGQLIWYYDKNKKQISGSIDRCTSDDEGKIYEAMGWHVIQVDGHNHDQIRSAIEEAKNVTDKPSLIVGESIMAKGSANMEGKHKTHGEPFSKDERLATKKNLGIPDNEEFYWPSDVQSHFKRRFESQDKKVHDWKKKIAARKASSPEFEKKLSQFFDSPNSSALSQIQWDTKKPLATRNAFGKIIEQWANELPNLIGGSADLEPSNMTGAFAEKVNDFTKENRKGRNLNFGVREFPMSAITNGLALYGGLVPFDATFLTFSDYSRPALRLGALQRCRVIHEFTHDSFYLGEDGPTHQPVEHVMSLRSIPNMYVMRPADSRETEVLMRKAISLNSPSSICLTRQKLNYLENPEAELNNAAKGAWVVSGDNNCNLVIYASGSEVHLAIQVAKDLKNSPLYNKVKIISVPCWELFEEQDKEYKNEIMTRSCTRRVSIEAGTSLGWERFIGIDGLSISLDKFGDSAPASSLEIEYGFNSPAICKKIQEYFSS